ncbi:Calcium-transporting ATPase 3 [Smittium culicis]|uniref:P-type Na(+) transporter n=1 Tax=Smittium culicis TaxID=133412 RepID=A0A1R1YRM7_9FUNG|nr:Calcium-transporting ATPase 3 [Smittium culicis]
MKSYDGLDAKNTDAFHTYSIAQATNVLDTDIISGLDSLKVEAKLLHYGENVLKGEGKISPLKIILRQFTNLLVFVLIGASVLGFVINDYPEGSVLLIIVILNSTIGFFQDYKAEKTVDSLKKLTSPLAEVCRNNKIVQIQTSELVPGDIISFKAGDVVGADCLLFEALNFETDEAALTGESLPVAKSIETIDNPDQPLADRLNVAFASTIVTKGRAKGIVFATGMNSELGKIATQLVKVSKINDTKKTKLQKSLNNMSLFLLVFAILLVILVFGVNKFKISSEVLIYAISLAIAVIPEGLLAVLTLTMALGVRRLSKQKALVRQINSLEVLGSVTDICSDKTGTLTQSKMVLVKAWIPYEGTFSVSGTGFEPIGNVSKLDTVQNTFSQINSFSDSFTKLATISSLCNSSEIKKDPSSGEWVGTGDPTEIALQVFSSKLGLGKQSLTANDTPNRHMFVFEFPFDSSIKLMSTIFKNSSNEYAIFTKGATEKVVECCDRIIINNKVTKISKSDLYSLINPQIDNLAKDGLRLISLAYSEIPTPNSIDDPNFKFSRDQAESSLIYAGLVGIYDPPRQESFESVMKCFAAGIKVHMLTGDHPATATSIAKQVGIIPSDNHQDPEHNIVNLSGLVMTASQFDALTIEEIDIMPELPSVIARCTPETKVNLINALHRRKRIVAMTGDGVNDSPSLKISDVGISMGITGSDVAKQASSIILTDDNFATIVGAIAEGRRLFTNIGKFIRCLIGANIAELVTLVIGLVFIDSTGQTVFPLSPVAILTNNLITATPPAMALGTEIASPDNMKVKPRSTDSGLFTTEVLTDIIVQGLYMGLLSILSFWLVIDVFGDGNRGSECNKRFSPSCDSVFRARATCFALLTILLMVFGYSCRDPRRQTCSLDKIRNVYQNVYLFHSFYIVLIITVLCIYIPGLNKDVFKHSPITWEWIIVLISIFAYLIGDALYKFIKLFIFKY